MQSRRLLILLLCAAFHLESACAQSQQAQMSYLRNLLNRVDTPSSFTPDQSVTPSWTSTPYVPQGTWQTNPFANLTPFGMLHYIWDDTRYVSSSNPVTLTEVRGELQQAQNYSQMAQSAATRAKYATNAQERQQAAAQAQQYAAMAQAAANQANQIAEGGSSNPADVAALAQQQADQARQVAAQAAARSTGSGW